MLYKKTPYKIVLDIILLLAIILPGYFLVDNIIFAQTQSCPSGMSSAECTRLQTELKDLEKEIADWQKILDETKAKKNTLQGDVTILNAEIAKAEKEIKQRGITVSTLNSEINKKIANISSLEERIDNNKNLLANLIKKKDQNEVEPIFYLLLSSNDLSDLITDIDEISMVNQGLQDLFIELRSVKDETQKEKESLDQKKNQELDAKYEVEVKKKDIAKNEAEKKQLLTYATKAESNYQEVLSERQRQAEVIRNSLFKLLDAGEIIFDKALEYANYASQKTGVRPALILGILEQESEMGKNVGRCNRASDPANKKYDVIMPGPVHYANYVANGKSCTGAASPCSWRDDQSIFISIVSELGRDSNNTPLSCPSTLDGGWGGAMGPSQFIPSTWQNIVPRLKTFLNVSTPDPWDHQTAIMATAIYLSDNGASVQGYTAEKNAAAKYYAGGNYLQTPGQNYANSVITKTEKFQSNIDKLSSSFLKNI